MPLVPILAALLALAWPAWADVPAAEFPASLEERIVAVSERVTPSVVHVEAIVRINDRRSQVTGSGFIVSEDGLVVTNQHVVERAEKVEVSVPGRKTPYPARILGTDKLTDLAVLRLETRETLPAVTFGEVADVRVGQWVLAIGNPYGLEGTVSLGIVSAKGRNLELPDTLNDFIQTDAMIDRGSSGGPLVDLEGRVMGVNSRGQGRGIGFTIPVDTVQRVMEQIVAGGVERGWLGIAIQPLDRELADYLGIPDATGLIVNGISESSPAERAGLQPGDVIVRFGETDVEAEKDEDLGRFQRLVANVPPGETVAIGILREREPRSVSATLATQPSVEPEEADTELGFLVQEITEGLYREERLATRDGVYVTFVAPGSPAAEAGLFPGDVIERVDDEPVGDLGAFKRVISDAEARSRSLLHARRGGDLRFLLVKRGAAASEPAEPTREPGAAAHRPDAGASPRLD